MTEKYGSDALRMSLIWGALIENDIALRKITGARNFVNKIWNASRFVIQLQKPQIEIPHLSRKSIKLFVMLPTTLKIFALARRLNYYIQNSGIGIATRQLKAKLGKNWHQPNAPGAHNFS